VGDAEPYRNLLALSFAKTPVWSKISNALKGLGFQSHVYPMPKKLRWLRSLSGSDGKPWKNWRLSRIQIRIAIPFANSSSPWRTGKGAVSGAAGRPAEIL
jgi:hypothetical protein